MSFRQPAFALIVFAAGFAAPSFGDGPTPPAAVAPTHDPDAARYLKALEGSIQTQTDDQAIASVQKLVKLWKDPAVSDETKKPIPGLVAWFARRKISPVALAGIAGLADIGKGEGAKNLVSVLDAVLQREDATPEISTAAFAALKKVADADPAVIAALQKLLLHKFDAVVDKAADALGGYGDAPAQTRLDLFEDMLRKFEGLASTAGAAVTLASKSALNKWNVVGASVLGTINALSHQEFATMAAARQWFNDHHKNLDAWK